MARVLIEVQSWAALARRGSNFRRTDDSAAVVYDVKTGGPSEFVRTLGLTTYEWIDEGEYRFDLGGEVIDVQTGGGGGGDIASNKFDIDDGWPVRPDADVVFWLGGGPLDSPALSMLHGDMWAPSTAEVTVI